jgi:hypothetical protein
MHTNDETRPRQQAINLDALRWAYAQDDLSVTMKAVLMSFALHANARGYTFPGVDHIASRWGMDRRTVRRQIHKLLVRRKLCRTKKRRGWTGQVRVYRLPKTIWGSGRKMHRFENDGSGAKAGTKRGQSGGEMYPEQGTRNTEPTLSDERGTPYKRTRRTRNSSVVTAAEEELSFYSDEERQIIDAYNETLVPLGWLAVNKHTLTVCAAIKHAGGDLDYCSELFTAAANGDDPVNIPESKTLVRLLWQNY